MNQGALNKNDILCWRELTVLPDGGKLAAIGALSFFSCLVVPFLQSTGVALLYALACVFFLYTLTHSIGSILVPALPVFLIYYFTSSIPLTVGFIAILMGGMSGAFVILCCRKHKKDYLWMLGAAAALLLVLLMKGDPLNALLVLLPLPGALAAALLFWRCTPHTPSLLVIAGVVSATLATALVVTLAATDNLTANPLLLLANGISDAVIATMTEARALYAELGISIAISDAEIAATAASIVNLLPGLFLAISTVTAFFIWRLFMQQLLYTGVLPRLPMRLAVLTVSPLAAALFILSYLVGLFAGGSASMAGAVAENLALVLEPGLALVGISHLFGRGRQRGCLSTLILFGLMYLLWVNPMTAFALGAFFGAISILFARFLPHSNQDNKGDK
ncbi:MAG: hypothetical protein E7663_02455 [Ruminococcaceae bacterium]|nr:hypothetical protein [Oscillospiraceae bacterium]